MKLEQLSDRTLRRARFAALVFVVVGSTAGILLELSGSQPGEALFSAGLLTFAGVGFFVLYRRPRERLAWLMVGMAFVVAVPFSAYGHYAIDTTGERLPFGALAIALGGPSWVGFIGISGYLLLLFPDGHLPSPRWRWFSWSCGIGLLLLALLFVFYPGDFTDSGYPNLENPLGVDLLAPVTKALPLFVMWAPILVLGGAAGLVIRLRRTDDDEVRHQIRWLAYAAFWIAGFYAISFIPALGNGAWSSLVQNIAVISFVLIPITIGIAVLRYRLYDIDVVIRKTVVFAVLAGFIAVIYAALVVGVGSLVGARGSPVLSAAAAAVVALVFGPVRARARRFADRLVYGQRATPYEVMAAFGDELAGSYASDDLLPRLARVLGEGVGATRARVWLRVGDVLRPVATWPEGASIDVEDDATVPVLHKGEELGALSVAQPPSDPIDPTKEKLIGDLAAQAGLVLNNVRLTEELRARLDDLRAAQKRLVTAQDEERRRLERNIHDGAQQQLVALTVKARLARQLTDRDTQKAAQLLEQIETETQIALEDLRDLARGIYPPLLADKGLAAALEAQARRSTVPAAVSSDGIARYPQEIEAAVYFSVLEALQNVAKYARASSVEVVLAQREGGLRFSVADDGRGFDPSATGYGTGLQGIADRLGVLDGCLEVRSSLGAGTTIEGSVPVATAPGGSEARRAP